MELDKPASRYFRDQLRSARYSAQADSEAYHAPLHALEHLGRHVSPPKEFSLGGYGPYLLEIAHASPFAVDIPERWRGVHSPFEGLYATVTDYRNDIMHVGTRARHLTRHSAELCMVLEDALNRRLNSVGDFMVTDMATVDRWQPVSLLRQLMLQHSFTYVPVRPEVDNGQWELVADHQLLTYLGSSSGRERMELLASPVGEALRDQLASSTAETVPASVNIDEARVRLGSAPVLVTSDDRVVGLITAFDLL